jgi:hypothetical protein
MVTNTGPQPLRPRQKQQTRDSCNYAYADALLWGDTLSYTHISLYTEMILARAGAGPGLARASFFERESEPSQVFCLHLPPEPIVGAR